MICMDPEKEKDREKKYKLSNKTQETKGQVPVLKAHVLTQVKLWHS